jgi:acyl-CoA thioester hydrolase
METPMKDYHLHRDFPVHWGECDALGHVNHTRYLVWFETVRCLFMAEMGIETSGELDIGPILANLNTNYHAPLHFPDTVRVGVRLSRLGNSSFDLEYAVVRTEEPSGVVCDGRTIMVLFNYATSKKQAIAGELRSRMESLLSR